VWLLIAVVAEPMPLPEPNIVERAADIAALPFWFLGLYVVVVALAPPMLRLHRRLGWWVPAALAAGAAAVDGVVHGLGHEAVGVANYAFVWLLPHQLGFFYEEGRLERISGIAAGTVALAGLAGLVLAVTVAGYPVSMIGVPGEDRWNTDPPSLALIALTAWLLGLALLARSRIATHQGGYSSVVRRLGTITLTTYLWHVSAVAIGAGIVYPLGFPTPDTGSLTWWLVRPLWIAVLVPWLMLLVVVFGRFEVHPRPRPVVPTSHESRRHVAAGIAVVSLAFGILGFGVTGFDHPATEYGGTVLAFSMNPLQNVVHVVAGLAVLGSVYAPDRFPGGAYVVSSLYVALGAIGWSDGVRTLAMNSATARLLVAVGALGLVALILAAAHDRRLRHRETWLDRRSS
jgi:fucose 4-O-acetylase-like acetyltransferase